MIKENTLRNEPHRRSRQPARAAKSSARTARREERDRIETRPADGAVEEVETRDAALAGSTAAAPAPLVDEDDTDAEPSVASAATEALADGDASAWRRYLRDMSRLPLPKPHEEFDRARTIERLELLAWERLLGHRPFVGPALAAAERVLGTSTPDARRLSRAVEGAVSLARSEMGPLAVRVAEQLREVDIDREALPAAIQDVEWLVSAGRVRGGQAARERMTVVLRAYRRVEREKHQFVQANLRLVFVVARRFRHHGTLSLEDLIQEGNLGLIKAVDRYDYRRGFRFSTYATWWIRHAIQRAIVDKGRMVRLPVHFVDSQNRLTRVRRELSARLGRDPSEDEVREAAGLDERKLERLDAAPLGQTLSLDRPVGEDDDDRRFLDYVRDPHCDEHSAGEAIDGETARQALQEELRSLRPMEADILRQRFGLDVNERTLKEIGQQYQLSRERIRQIEQQALRKLEKALRRRQLD